MSSFVVQDRTINRVVSYLAMSRHSDLTSGIGNGFFTRLEVRNGPAALASEMFALNVQAVDSRYTGAAARFRSLDFTFTHVMPEGPHAVLKSLHCWLYQCAEGDVPETPLYKALEDVSHRLAYRIASDDKAFELAAWDG